MAKTYLSLKHATYEVISVETAKGQGLYQRYKHSVNYYGCRWLRDCYERPSYAKEDAYEYCRCCLCDFDNFERDTIIGYNSMQFSYGAIVTLGLKTYCLYITKEHNYLVEL